MEAGIRRGWADYAGALIGYLAWTLALAVVCMIAGRWEWLYQLCLPAFLVSLGLGLSTVCVLGFALRVSPHDRSLFQTCLWARLLTDVGILLLLNTEWLLPRIREDQELSEFLSGSLQATIHFPSWVGMICLAAGCVLSVAAARRIHEEVAK